MTLITSDIAFGILHGGEELQTLRLQRLYQDWTAACAGSELPGYGFGNPGRLIYLMGCLVVLGVEYDGHPSPRYCHRLIGVQVVERRGRDHTGGYVDAIPEKIFAEVGQRACDMVLDSRRPVHVVLQRDIGDQTYPIETLVLPLAGETGRIDRLLAAELHPIEIPFRQFTINAQTA